MSAPRTASTTASQLFRSFLSMRRAVSTLAVVAILALTAVAFFTDAAGARGAETATPETIVMADHGDMYAAMADIAAVLASLPAPIPPTTAPLRQAQTRIAATVTPDDPGVWDALAHCESGGNWATDSVAGFSGGLGFAHGTWASNGGTEFSAVAADATREQQIEVAQRVLEGSGWGAWPGCSSLLGLR